MAENKIAPEMKIQRTLFDLDSMEEVTLIKVVTDFTPVTDVNEALAKLGNDNAKLIKIINRGLLDERKKEITKDANFPWQIEDEDSKTLTPFTGTPALQAPVNALVLNLAKTAFGYKKDASREQKQNAKKSAFDFVKNNEQLRNGLKETAAAAFATEADEDEETNGSESTSGSTEGQTA